MRERARFAFEVVAKELGLVSGHIHRDGALTFASLAGEAEIKRFFDLLVLPLIGQDLALHQLPEKMSATTSGMELLTGSHKAGTHGASVGLATGADADAA